MVSASSESNGRTRKVGTDASTIVRIELSAGLATRTAMVLCGSANAALQWLTFRYHWSAQSKRPGVLKHRASLELIGLRSLAAPNLLRFVEEELDMVPVDQVVEPGLEVLRAGVAV